MAGNAARDNKKHRIVPRHLQLAIRNDEELSKLLGDVVISQGGVVPFINPEVGRFSPFKLTCSLLPCSCCLTRQGRGKRTARRFRYFLIPICTLPCNINYFIPRRSKSLQSTALSLDWLDSSDLTWLLGGLWASVSGWGDCARWAAGTTCAFGGWAAGACVTGD